MFDSAGNFYFGESLQHHGIKGQHWGDRNGPPYPLGSGAYSKSEKKFIKKMKGKGEVTIKKGHTFDRVEGSNTDTSKGKDKVYVTSSTDKYDKDLYRTSIGLSNMQSKGEAYVAKYITNKDIKLPSIKTQEKMELNLLKDPEARNEVVDSLVKKGMSREEAYKQTKALNVGKEYCKNALLMSSLTALSLLTFNPIVVAAFASEIAATPESIKRQERLIRNTMGDKEAKKLNANFEKALRDKGYGGYRDTNDKYNGMRSNTATVLINPSDISQKSIRKMTKEDFSRSYANNRINREAKFLGKGSAKRLQKEVPASVLEKEGAEVFEKALKRFTDAKQAKKRADVVDKIMKENDEELKKLLAQ